MRVARALLLISLILCCGTAIPQQSEPDPFEGLWTAIDLEAADENPQDVLERLVAQAGEKFEPLPSCSDRKISVKLKGVPFWRALDEICRLDGNLCHPDRPFDQSTRYVVASPWIAHPAWYGGPLRLYVHDVARVRELRYPERADRTEVVLVLQWSSRVEPARSLRQWRVGSIRLTRAEDDKGKSLLPLVEVDDSFDISLGGGVTTTACPWLVRLEPVSAGARKIALLEGEWEGAFLTEIEEVKFDNPLDSVGASKKVGPMTVTLSTFKRNRHVDEKADYYSYAIRVSYDSTAAGREWLRTLRDVPLGRRVLSVVDLGLKKPQSTSLIWEQEPEEGPPQDDRWTEFWGWSWGACPPSITLRVAQGVRRVRAKFALKDIPLPEE